MKRRMPIRLVVVVLVAAPALWWVSLPHYRVAACQRQLGAICRMSLIYAGDYDEVHPDSLRRLVDFGMRPSALTCPAVKSGRGEPQDIDQWSSYRFRAGTGAAYCPPPILVYCRPENHGGRCGHIAFSDAHLETLEEDAFIARLAEYGIVDAPGGP